MRKTTKLAVAVAAAIFVYLFGRSIGDIRTIFSSLIMNDVAPYNHSSLPIENETSAADNDRAQEQTMRERNQEREENQETNPRYIMNNRSEALLAYPPPNITNASIAIAMTKTTAANSTPETFTSKEKNRTSHQHLNGTSQELMLRSPPSKNGSTAMLNEASAAESLSRYTEKRNGTLSLASPLPRQLQGTIILKLGGELGNHLSILAVYYAVKTIASAEYNLNLTLHVWKQNLPRGRKQDSTAIYAKTCFKSFQNLDFDECDWNKGTLDVMQKVNSSNPSRGRICDRKINKQLQFFENESKMNPTYGELAKSLIVNNLPDQIREDLKSYVAMLQDHHIIDLYRQRGLGWNSDEPHPFLYNPRTLFASWEIINEFWAGLANYFTFDEGEGNCCRLMPEKDEHAFHYRSFGADLVKRHREWGGAELKPEQAANLLSNSIPKGSKVAIVSGRARGNRTLMYREAFEAKSFTVRIISGQTATQDLCFLSHAKAGLWGTEKSTYAKWASLINTDLQNATLYILSYPTRETNRSVPVLNNTHLAKILHHPILNVSDEDIW